MPECPVCHGSWYEVAPYGVTHEEYDANIQRMIQDDALRITVEAVVRRVLREDSVAVFLGGGDDPVALFDERINPASIVRADRVAPRESDDD